MAETLNTPTKIPDAKQPPAIKSIPDARIYREENKNAANELPPAPVFVERSGNKLPTDQEVKEAQNRKLPGEQNKTLEPVSDEGVDDVLEDEIIVDEAEKTRLSEEKKKKDAESKAELEEKTKKDAESIAEFNLDGIDNDEDLQFLKELGFENKKEEKSKLDKDGNPVVERSKDAKIVESELEEKYKPFKAQAQEYEAVKADPLLKALIEFRKAGKSDILEFAQSVGFVNVDKMSDEDVLNHEYTKAGLTPEDAAIEKEAFDGMTPLAKKKHINSIKAELKQENDSKLKSFTAGNEETEKINKQAADNGMAQLNDLIPKMEGKKYEGLLIEPEKANRIKQYVIDHPEPILDDKGRLVGYDIKASIETAVSKLYKNEWKKALIELGRNIGAKKALEARIRTNKNHSTSGAAPITQKTEKQFFAESSNKIWERRGFKPTKK